MGATGIEWTRNRQGTPGYTFNPWIGCTKVSGACDNCYAETAAIKLDTKWGPHADRRGVSGNTWSAPLAWNRKAARLGERLRVFSGSMCDILDNHRSIKPDWRWWLYTTVVDTPNLDWLLLTKRPENAHLLPVNWLRGKWPPNVWFGVTVENQKAADHRLQFLRNLPAPIKFLSVEPMLGPVLLPADAATFIHWVIVGGESGPLAKTRDTNLAWVRDLKRQCENLGIPFFMKQMPQISHRGTYKKFDHFPADLQVRAHPRRAS